MVGMYVFGGRLYKDRSEGDVLEIIVDVWGEKKKVDTYSTEISQYIASACKKKENNE